MMLHVPPVGVSCSDQQVSCIAGLAGSGGVGPDGLVYGIIFSQRHDVAIQKPSAFPAIVVQHVP
jgi:hypothetical protein